MDSKRRGRAGFLNGKLMRWSLYRATTAQKLPPPSTAVLHLPYAAKAKPNPTSDHGGYIKMQNQKDRLTSVKPPHQRLTQLPTQTRSVSYYHPTADVTNKTVVDSYSAVKMDAVYGGIAVDEEVDRKAANYISSVREKFGLAYLN